MTPASDSAHSSASATSTSPAPTTSPAGAGTPLPTPACSPAPSSSPAGTAPSPVASSSASAGTNGLESPAPAGSSAPSPSTESAAGIPSPSPSPRVQRVDASTLRRLVGEVKPHVIELRRQIHRLAELSGQEVQTSALICRELDELGIAHHPASPTSVVGVLDTGRPGRCVALRADIDALPIAEDPENLAGPRTCVSQTGATCHACGHDGHAAMLLGAARALARLRDAGELSGTVILCFEAAEETMSAFPQMLAAIERYPIESAWGIHLYAGLESGRICVDAGPRMAGAADLDVTIRGKGGHGSRPDMARNPIFAAANLLTNLAVAWVNQLAPDTPVTLGPTTILGGQAFNVIPDEARILGSLRYFDADAGHQALRIVREVAEHTAAMHGCTAQVGGRADLALPVINDARAARLATDALAEVLPAGTTVPCEPWYASESFGHYLQRYPGVFAHVGIANPAWGSGAPHHTPQFDLDEGVLASGVAATLAYAVRFLERGFDPAE